MTVVVEAEARRQTEGPVGGQVPGNDGREIVRGIVQAKTVAVAESAVEFDSGDEILRAETTVLGGGFQSQRTTGADCVAELPGIASSDVLGGDGIFGDVPSVEGL